MLGVCSVYGIAEVSRWHDELLPTHYLLDSIHTFSYQGPSVAPKNKHLKV
jgi:hypothetical protein